MLCYIKFTHIFEKQLELNLFKYFSISYLCSTFNFDSILVYTIMFLQQNLNELLVFQRNLNLIYNLIEEFHLKSNRISNLILQLYLKLHLYFKLAKLLKVESYDYET